MWPGQRGDIKGQPLHPNLRLRWYENISMLFNITARMGFLLLLAAALSIHAFVFNPIWLIPPAVARPNAEGVARNAPHPHAAVLFFDFLISDGQSIFASRQFVPASRKIETPLAKIPLKLIDSSLILDHARKWQDLFQKTIISPSR